MRRRLRSLLDGEGRPRYGLFVDGPNLLRDDVDVDLAEVREAIASRGELAIARVYLDHRAPARLVQAVEAAGFAVRTTSGDVDVRLAVEATSAVERGVIDGLAVASRDLDFTPAIELARERGVRTLVLVPDGADRSAGLLASADEVVTLGA